MRIPLDVLLAIRQADLRLAVDLLLREEPGLTVVSVACETKGLIALLRTFMHYLSLGLKYRES